MFTLKSLSRSSRHRKDVSQHITSNECWHSTAAEEESAPGIRERAKLAQMLNRPHCYYVYEALGLKFPFQKCILLHYLPNRAQLCSFLGSLSSKAGIQGAAAPQNDTDSRANRVDRTAAGGQDELQSDCNSQAMISSYLIVRHLIMMGSERGRNILLRFCY